MKVRMMSIAVISAMTVLATGAVFAGSKFTGNGNVRIARAADGSGTAVGYLGSIYNGPGMTQWMGCQLSDGNNIYCAAHDEAGLLMTCAATSAFLAQSVSSISPDVRLAFAWNARGTCTRIQVMHSSELEDKQD